MYRKQPTGEAVAENLGYLGNLLASGLGVLAVILLASALMVGAFIAMILVGAVVRGLQNA